MDEISSNSIYFFKVEYEEKTVEVKTKLYNYEQGRRFIISLS